ncbi:hypothetical protein CYLTODRAFT_323038, partial [Cylindrobasidium torrendii FP15055 ss-10]
LERNAASTRDFTRKVPHPLVVEVLVAGHPCRALLDSGSVADFISGKVLDQLKLKSMPLEKPIDLHLAVQGSRSKVNFGTRQRIEYQGIDEERYFDVANLTSYDLVLGTPFLFQHKVSFGLNPCHIVIGSTEGVPIEGVNVSKIDARAIEMLESELTKARSDLHDRARTMGLYADAAKQPLPPLRDINHSIPLIDESKQYRWRPSKCPEPLQAQWIEKRNDYLATGRWRMSTARNTVPMLAVFKP